MAQIDPPVSSPSELAPVELDPPTAPNPKLTRWEQLTERDLGVNHGGDVEKISPYPRPVWADPDSDEVGTSRPWCSYNSDPVFVPACDMSFERINNDVFIPSNIRVRARRFSNGDVGVGVSMNHFRNRKWADLGVTLSLDEVHQLVDALSAAIELLEDDELTRPVQP